MRVASRLGGAMSIVNFTMGAVVVLEATARPRQSHRLFTFLFPHHLPIQLPIRSPALNELLGRSLLDRFAGMPFDYRLCSLSCSHGESVHVTPRYLR